MKKKRKLGRKLLGFLLALALVLGLMPGMSMTAQARTEETLLTTVTYTNGGSQTHSTEGVVTVTLNGVTYNDDTYGWLFYRSGTVTVAPVDGVEITKVRFRQNGKNPVDDDLAPFTLTFNDYGIGSVETSTGTVSARSMDGVTSIEVYRSETIEEYTVTYKVVNGTWDGSSTADKTESVESGASPASVPAGMKADSGYTGGSWDKNPSEATITENTTFTYTFNAKTAATVTTAPAAKTLTYNGEEQALVTAGEAADGEMQYALGTKDAATGEYSASIPTGTDAGTYYVWYMVRGDENHIDSEPACVKVTIEEEKKDEKEETDDKGEVDEKEETDKKDETGTSIETEVNIADGAPAVKVDNLNNELAVKLLTDEEKAEYEGGTPVQVYLDVKALDKASVPAIDLTAIEKKISDDGYTYGECLDLSLWKKVGDSTAVQIHDTNGNPISVTIPIPDTLKNVPAGYTRTFSIVRVHHGAMSVLGEGTGNSITIKTDEFSSYFIIFKDVKNATDDKKQDSPKVDAPKKDTAKAPATGDKINIGMIVMLMIDCVMAGVYLTLRRRMEK